LGNEYLSNPLIQTQTDDKNELLDSLTKTECFVLKQIADNKTSKEIADIFSVSAKTIENHRNNISKKLHIKGYSSLIRFAINNKRFF